MERAIRLFRRFPQGCSGGRSGTPVGEGLTRASPRPESPQNGILNLSGRVFQPFFTRGEADRSSLPTPFSFSSPIRPVKGGRGRLNRALDSMVSEAHGLHPGIL